MQVDQPSTATHLRATTNALDLAKALPPATIQRTGRNTSHFEHTAVSTCTAPDGSSFNPRIVIESRREYSELAVMYRVIEAKAIAPGGAQIAECSFYTCRRPRTKPEMDAEWIADELDNISSSVSRMAYALLEIDQFNFEDFVNQSSLVVAERIEVQPEFRGTSFWKELFALCLHHSLEPRMQVPEIGYLNAFPLEFEGKVQGNEAAFARGKRRLQLLYAMNLGARVVTDEVLHGCLMEFPIRWSDNG